MKRFAVSVVLVKDSGICHNIQNYILDICNVNTVEEAISKAKEIALGKFPTHTVFLTTYFEVL